MNTWAVYLLRAEWKMLAPVVFFNQDAPTINATPWGLGATWEAALDSQTWLIEQSVPSQPAGEGLLQRVEGL